MARRRLLKKRIGKIGTLPGTLVHVGETRTAIPRLTTLRYNAEQVVEFATSTVAEARAGLSDASVTWLNLDGLHQVELLEEIGSAFGVHPLVLEDILNTDHRPKFEAHDQSLFLVTKMLTFNHEQHEIINEQISLVLGANYVITFQERPGDLFDGLRERIRTNKGRLRRLGPDFLTYCLLDQIIDRYFVLLEQIGDHIEQLEEELIDRPDRALLHRIHHEKREMILLRRAIWPLREVIGGLQRDESGLVTAATQPFLRDLYDHTIQIIDTIETFRDLITGMLDLYLSSVSNRMNEIMKVLTIISTLFIPLTFLVGVYGMNFDVLPELHWRWGYFVLWGVMLASAGGMFVFFRRKRWL